MPAFLSPCELPGAPCAERAAVPFPHSPSVQVQGGPSDPPSASGPVSGVFLPGPGQGSDLTSL